MIALVLKVPSPDELRDRLNEVPSRLYELAKLSRECYRIPLYLREQEVLF